MEPFHLVGVFRPIVEAWTIPHFLNFFLLKVFPHYQEYKLGTLNPGTSRQSKLLFGFATLLEN